MRTRPTLLSALAFGACMSALAGACQTYDFEPVEPLAIAQTTFEEPLVGRKPKPNVMLLVDTSGSMTEPVDTSDPDCQLPGGEPGETCAETDPCNPAVCPTRWTELQAAVPKFLADTGAFVRFGLTTYPDTRGEDGLAASCRGASSTSVRKDLPVAEDDASLLVNANAINDLLQGIPNAGTGRPKGGTPTSLSLRFVKDLPGLQNKDRRQFVVLLTDGLPNCNEQNAYEISNPLCRCTLSTCSAAGKSGCLDMDASVEAVRELLAKEITTIVIGFGTETAEGNGPAVLDAMARAGGFARTCKEGETSCGANDPCDPVTRLCQRPFYQAGNQTELAQVLEAISKELVDEDACLIRLDPSQLPSDPKLIVVYVEGERTPAGADTWELTDDGVLFTGAMCERIKASTPDAPVDVGLRAIRQR
ncbi:adventurous gliding motility lipoprotein CglB [Pyxidicoccus caerfyrddinensis]|uniref:adventurous gliding motility lipoprotein CglB n=1 Tax=Pyxidicoccus caerfyrddinensis TaxID=2709663 RepID=UPI0013DD4A58|nr:adventurous gliding motility lipoprotein CglB [Pyxidicoccus caerfyrddinensis]